MAYNVIKQLPTLYVREDDKIREWDIAAVKQDNTIKVVSFAGIRGGKMTRTEVTISSGKNIGKSNETTIEEQAVLYATSKWEDKRKRGYKSLEDIGVIDEYAVDEQHNVWYFVVNNYTDPLTLEQVLKLCLPKERTTKEGNRKPMKCQKYFKEVKEGQIPVLKFPHLAQVKINGVRAFLEWDYIKKKAVLSSKEGLVYNIPHITTGLKKEDFMTYTQYAHIFYKYDVIDYVIHIYITNTIADETEEVKIPLEESMIAFDVVKQYMNENHSTVTEVIYDGELYIHNVILSEIVSACRVYSLLSPQLQFRTFDLAIDDAIQLDRLNMLKLQVEKLNNPNIVYVSYNAIRTHDEAIKFRDWAISKGYEGSIHRKIDGKYEFGKRPSCITKFKQRESAEFMILDVVDTDKQPEIGIFLCRNDVNQQTFKVNPQGTLEQRHRYYLDRLLLKGKMLTVEFYERTKEPENLPFHAVGIAVRDYE